MLDLADGDDVDEEDDAQNEEDNDGWLAAEDDLGTEDDDDETRALRKKNTSASSGKPSLFKACVVAPRMGGLPHKSFSEDDVQCVIEGFTPRDAMDVLASHVGCVITPDVSICLDAFPPSDAPKDASQAKKETGGKSSASQSKEMTVEAQVTMAKFVHNSTLTSKEIVITALLNAHPTVTNSRAQAMRELEVIAEKRRLAKGGVLWEVKAEHLKKLGLEDKDLVSASTFCCWASETFSKQRISLLILLLCKQRKPPQQESPPKSSDGEKTKKAKKDKDPNAPKRAATAYQLYSSATRNDLKEANPEVRHTDITKMISEKFKALTPEELAPWNEKAAADKERYQKEMAEYKSKNAAASGDDKATATSSSSPKAAESQAKKPSSATKKRKEPDVSQGSAKLLATFLANKKPKST